MTDSFDMAAAQAEYEERDRQHDALLATLTVPADDDRGTYTGRVLQAQWVKTREASATSFAITGTSNWTAGCSEEIYDLLPEGRPYILETRNFSQITGWIIDGRWYDRKTNEDLEAEHQAWKARWDQQQRDQLEENRSDWQRREDLLPDWVRARLSGFHEKGGERFALQGWGYELIIAELAVEYAALGKDILTKDQFTISDIESEAIRAIARGQGTSGNQHGCALALAKAHLREQSVADTISALSPLTGDPFYAGASTSSQDQPDAH